jgi:hypothetical protein
MIDATAGAAAGPAEPTIERASVAPIALTPGAGEALWFLGCLLTVKSSTESTADAWRSSSTSLHAAQARRCTCTTRG